MSNIIKQYNIDNVKSGALSLGELTDKLFEAYLYQQPARKDDFDKLMKEVIDSYSFLLKRLSRSEEERFNTSPQIIKTL